MSSHRLAPNQRYLHLILSYCYFHQSIQRTLKGFIVSNLNLFPRAYYYLRSISSIRPRIVN